MSQRNRLPVGLLCACALATGCSVGVDPGTAAPEPAITHGEPAEVVAALAARGARCEDVKTATVFAVEEAARCVIDDEPVVIVHFFGEQQGREYQEFRRSQGQHGVFAATWAIETQSVELAQRVSRLMPGTTFG